MILVLVPDLAVPMVGFSCGFQEKCCQTGSGTQELYPEPPIFSKKPDTFTTPDFTMFPTRGEFAMAISFGGWPWRMFWAKLTGKLDAFLHPSFFVLGVCMDNFRQA
jgi:hypothetical protein